MELRGAAAGDAVSPTKTSYSGVSTDDDEEGPARAESPSRRIRRESDAAPASRLARVSRLWTRTLVPDGPNPTVKVAKLFLITYLLLLFDHVWIRSSSSWERDAEYDLGKFHLYDLHPVALDTLWYFVVGRMWERRGVDSLAFIGPCFLGLWLFSAAGTVKWTHHSISTYSIACDWPRELFVAAAALSAFALVLVGLHVRRACRRGIFCGRIIEIATTAAIFVLPGCEDSNLHWHHWFLCWFGAQHANQAVWWSSAVSALLWGGYVNGVAAWGRDDMLGCKRAWDLSARCAFLQECTWPDPANENRTLAAKFTAPSWRNCSKEGNYSP
ncbi:hypothetical protein M885DRAFT_535366 [Pelagophyceae sp. CCMP2097]|nr:hypothetical protein M885DRAFT_535366 [Pelagophyceae sp. CCMP2097]